jgi:hypothetical protein
MRSVVGVTPSGRIFSPSSALMNELFPRVELARDHQEEEGGERLARLVEVAQVVRVHVRAEAPQRRRQPVQQLALPGAQLQLALPQQPVAPPQQSQRHAHPPRFP